MQIFRIVNQALKRLLPAVVCLAGVSATAATTNNYWTGGAGDGLWSSAANWTGGVPDTNHIVHIGETNCPDVAQVITLDVPTAKVWQVYFECEGNRFVTVDGVVGATTNTLQPLYNTTYIYTFPASADSGTLIDCLLWYEVNTTRGWHSVYNTNIVTYGPNCEYNTSKASYESRGNGPWRIQGRFNKSWRPRHRGTVYLDGGYLSGVNPDQGMDFKLESDSRIGGIAVPNVVGQQGSFQRVGAGDRTTTVAMTTRTSGNQPTYDSSTNYFEVLENTVDDGHLTLRCGWWRLLTAHILTDEDTTVELHNGGDRRMEFLHEPGVQGPGRVVMNMDSPSQTFPVYGSGFGHTGDTILNTGILFMTSQEITTNSTVYERGLVATGTYDSVLAPESFIQVGTNATLDLNGIDQTSGPIGGEGEILLDGATLTAKGARPGLSVGTLPVNGAGELVLDASGTTTIEINSTSDYDVVVLPDADLTIDGTLSVVVNGPMTQDLYTDYTIFSLTNGAASGTFTDFEDNVLGFASAEIVGNDVILTMNEPAGTAIIIR